MSAYSSFTTEDLTESREGYESLLQNNSIKKQSTNLRISQQGVQLAFDNDINSEVIENIFNERTKELNTELTKLEKDELAIIAELKKIAKIEYIKIFDNRVQAIIERDQIIQEIQQTKDQYEINDLIIKRDYIQQKIDFMFEQCDALKTKYKFSIITEVEKLD